MASNDWGDFEIRTDIPHAGRMYDYMLGGITNFESDREASRIAGDDFPGGIEAAKATLRANRDFLGRAVRFMAEAGVRQFLDLGTGIPSDDNTHAVALSVAPDSKIVYVDNDPVVLAHAHELLRNTADSSTSYLYADIRDTDEILRQARETLDFDQPVGLVLVAILHFITDEDDAHGLVSRLLDAMPSGSYLAISHLANDIVEGITELYQGISEKTKETFFLRDRAGFTRFFDGMELVDPGITTVGAWHTDEPPKVPDTFYAAVARKP
ncbi:MAG TPA: SAM-dependent methyltransferase [Acidimicrobiales bacterium]